LLFFILFLVILGSLAAAVAYVAMALFRQGI
jgi:hypothetical protein